MICQRCDTELPVTTTQPGQAGNNPLAVTTLAEIQASGQQECPRWFTCTFPGRYVAVMRVYGTQSQDQARAAVHTCWQKCQYTVTDGDESHGHAAPFTLILKRNTLLLRFGQGGSRDMQQAVKTAPALTAQAVEVTGNQPQNVENVDCQMQVRERQNRDCTLS
jgi:hypothetical protein